ncbi:hypothetical protein CAPTEDRAFT_191938 [Capitella teleta]|uniref:Ig-like domain-containing protein n=1 Tax=Capitella teleta TaxID=283909 RepID=R7T951_CAPTE|nr:hypothetical protein CAPTEDRAFT_191938 [Capitella teleta]|eukprot:ELT89963.1 hypothetical protein CAPTEDRAFT_191938 [Capitella teleta]
MIGSMVAQENRAMLSQSLRISSCVELLQTVSLLSMLSKGHVYIVKPGDSVVLHCEFVAEYFNLFDHPVVWKKVQLGEETQINMLGNLIPPFDNDKKFTTYFEESPPRYTLGLDILNVSQEDSGNYTCVVPSINATPLGSTTYRLYVPAPIHSLSLASTHQDLSASVKQLRHREVNPQIHLQESVPSTLQCVSHGGYPAPRVELFIGRRNITNLFKVTEHTKLRGRVGLRSMDVFLEATTYNFIPSAEDDGERLKCKVSVDGLGSNATIVKLHVDYAPVIKCYPASAVVGQRRVSIHCDVRARPLVTSLFWIIDENGTRVSLEAADGDYYPLVRDIGENTLQTKLYIDVAQKSNFHSYTLVAANALESKRETVMLKQPQDYSPSYL